MSTPSLMLLSLALSLGGPSLSSASRDVAPSVQTLARAPAGAPTEGPIEGPIEGPSAGPSAAITAGPSAAITAGPSAGPSAAITAGPSTPSPADASLPSQPPIPAEIALLDRRQHRIQTAGMATLTAWSIANIVSGVAGNLATPRGNPWRYAHQMNAMWNTVNLTLGAIGLANARKARSKIGRRLGVQADVAKTQRIFAVNALLDVAYMLGGVITWELGKDRESPRLIGYGASIIGQGAFLMLFDLAMVSAHERGLRKSLPGYSIGAMPMPGGAALSLGGAF